MTKDFGKVFQHGRYLGIVGSVKLNQECWEDCWEGSMIDWHHVLGTTELLKACRLKMTLRKTMA